MKQDLETAINFLESANKLIVSYVEDADLDGEVSEMKEFIDAKRYEYGIKANL